MEDKQNPLLLKLKIQIYLYVAVMFIPREDVGSGSTMRLSQLSHSSGKKQMLHRDELDVLYIGLLAK